MNDIYGQFIITRMICSIFSVVTSFQLWSDTTSMEMDDSVLRTSERGRLWVDTRDGDNTQTYMYAYDKCILW